MKQTFKPKNETIREDLFSKGALTNVWVPIQTVECNWCKEKFDRLASRPWDKTCGYCLYPSKKRADA